MYVCLFIKQKLNKLSNKHYALNGGTYWNDKDAGQ